MTKIEVVKKKLNKVMTKIKVTKKKLNLDITKSILPKKKLKIVFKKLRFLSKVKQRYNKIEVVKNIYTLESKN